MGGVVEGPEVCETGIWVDSESGQVVTSPPLTGVQLVPPGGEMRPDRVRAVEAARAEAAPVVVQDATDPTSEDKAITKAPARKTRARKKA